MTNRRQALGAAGEDQTAAWYSARGYEVLARNWRCQEGELDLVLRHGRIVVFCEVKTRSSVAFGLPAEAVTPVKQRRVRRLALSWLQESGTHYDGLRFDVASVLAGELSVIEAAF